MQCCHGHHQRFLGQILVTRVPYRDFEVLRDVCRWRFSPPSPSPHPQGGKPYCSRCLTHVAILGPGRIQTPVFGGQPHRTKVQRFNRAPPQCIISQFKRLFNLQIPDVCLKKTQNIFYLQLGALVLHMLNMTKQHG